MTAPVDHTAHCVSVADLSGRSYYILCTCGSASGPMGGVPMRMICHTCQQAKDLERERAAGERRASQLMALMVRHGYRLEPWEPQIEGASLLLVRGA